MNTRFLMVGLGQLWESPSRPWLPEQCPQMAAAAKEDPEASGQGKGALPEKPVSRSLRHEARTVEKVSSQAGQWRPLCVTYLGSFKRESQLLKISQIPL